MMRSISLLLVLLAATGCSSIFGVDEDDRPQPVEFEILGFIEPADTTLEEQKRYRGLPELEATAGEEEILVNADFYIPCINYRPFAEATRRGRTITLRVDYRREPNCAATTIKYAYEARLPELLPGTYDLIVMHRLWAPLQEPIGMRAVLEQEITVH